jgi:hypothetical protein
MTVLEVGRWWATEGSRRSVAGVGKLPVLEVPIVDYGDDEEAMLAYRGEGEARAASLGNRGPITFDERGRIHQSILDAYD